MSKSDRRAEGLGWGIAFLGTIIGVGTCFTGQIQWGFGITVGALILACYFYYR